MQGPDKFQSFYENSLRDQLLSIEAERVKEYKKVKEGKIKGIIAGLILAAFIALGAMAMQPEPGIILFGQLFLVFGIFFGLAGFGVGYHYTIGVLDKFKLPFKNKIITPIVKQLNPNLKYLPKERITNEEVAASKLFQDNIDYYQGDDMIEGKEGNVKFRFSELRLHIEVKQSDKDGRPIMVNIPFFKGVFLVAEFPKPIIDCLIIRPNLSFEENKEGKDSARIAAEKKTLKNNKKYFSWSANKVKVAGTLKEVQTGDKSFNEQFDVYSTNEFEAKKLLGQNLEDQITVIKQKDYKRAYFDWLNGNSRGDFHLPSPYCSIIGNKLYLAKPYNRRFFNTDMESSVVNPALMEMYYYDIKELLDLTKEVINSVRSEKII